MSDMSAVQDLLTDSFTRIHELVVEVTDGCSRDQARYRPDPDANSIAWLIWHLARVQDDHLAGLQRGAGVEQVWTGAGWQPRFGLPFEAGAIGYGFSSEQVGRLDADPAMLADYHAAVHERTLAYVGSLPDAELDRVVDESWDPPVTVSVRLVSVISDCLQHAGQAAYVKGLVQRSRRK